MLRSECALSFALPCCFSFLSHSLHFPSQIIAPVSVPRSRLICQMQTNALLRAHPTRVVVAAYKQKDPGTKYTRSLAKRTRYCTNKAS